MKITRNQQVRVARPQPTSSRGPTPVAVQPPDLNWPLTAAIMQSTHFRIQPLDVA
jgi:hypothetical protein